MTSRMTLNFKYKNNMDKYKETVDVCLKKKHNC